MMENRGAELGSHRHVRRSRHYPRGIGANPVPRTYVRGFGALPLQGGWNIHPVPTVLEWGRIVLSRWSLNGVHPRAYARGVLWHGVNSGREVK